MYNIIWYAMIYITSKKYIVSYHIILLQYNIL